MTETQLDFTQSISLSGVVLLERVQKTVDIGYQFTLVTYKFKDMGVIFDLAYSQYVKVAMLCYQLGGYKWQ